MAKQLKAADVKSRSQMGHACGKCGKVHKGLCRFTSGCHKCGKKGHYVRDCCQPNSASSIRICYHCDQVGHMKVKCPFLAAKPVQALAPATLRIANEHQWTTEPLRDQVHAFQFTTAEAKETPNVMTSIFLFIVMSTLLWYAYVYDSIRSLPSELFSCSCVIWLKGESLLRVLIF